MKNHGAYDPCELCMPDLSSIITTSNDGFPISIATGDMLVYYTSNGVYYHIKPDCSGMQNAELHTVEQLSKESWTPEMRAEASERYRRSLDK